MAKSQQTPKQPKQELRYRAQMERSVDGLRKRLEKLKSGLQENGARARAISEVDKAILAINRVDAAL